MREVYCLMQQVVASRQCYACQVSGEPVVVATAWPRTQNTESGVEGSGLAREQCLLLCASTMIQQDV